MFSSDYSTAVHLANVQYQCVVKIGFRRVTVTVVQSVYVLL